MRDFSGRVFGALVVVAVMSFGGCTSETDDRSAAGTGGSSRTADPVATASGSPAMEFEVGPAIKPDIVFKGKFDTSDRTFVKRTIERAFRYFEVPHPAGGPVKRYAEIYGQRSPYESESLYCGRRTDAGGIQIYLYACKELGRAALTATIVHEVFHAMQDFTRDTYRKGPDIVVDGIYPKWFEEGSAVWVTAKVLEEWGVESYQERRSYELDLVEGVEATLKQLETHRGWFKRGPQQEGRQYGLAFFGAEKALEGHDWRAALEVQQRTVSPQVPRWDRAFQQTFGISMKRFYEEFTRFSASGFER